MSLSSDGGDSYFDPGEAGLRLERDSSSELEDVRTVGRAPPSGSSRTDSTSTPKRQTASTAAVPSGSGSKGRLPSSTQGRPPSSASSSSRPTPTAARHRANGSQHQISTPSKQTAVASASKTACEMSSTPKAQLSKPKPSQPTRERETIVISDSDDDDAVVPPAPPLKHKEKVVNLISSSSADEDTSSRGKNEVLAPARRPSDIGSSEQERGTPVKTKRSSVGAQKQIKRLRSDRSTSTVTQNKRARLGPSSSDQQSQSSQTKASQIKPSQKTLRYSQSGQEIIELSSSDESVNQSARDASEDEEGVASVLDEPESTMAMDEMRPEEPASSTDAHKDDVDATSSASIIEEESSGQPQARARGPGPSRAEKSAPRSPSRLSSAVAASAPNVGPSARQAPQRLSAVAQGKQREVSPATGLSRLHVTNVTNAVQRTARKHPGRGPRVSRPTFAETASSFSRPAPLRSSPETSEEIIMSALPSPERRPPKRAPPKEVKKAKGWDNLIELTLWNGGVVVLCRPEADHYVRVDKKGDRVDGKRYRIDNLDTGDYLVTEDDSEPAAPIRPTVPKSRRSLPRSRVASSVASSPAVQEDTRDRYGPPAPPAQAEDQDRSQPGVAGLSGADLGDISLRRMDLPPASTTNLTRTDRPGSVSKVSPSTVSPAADDLPYPADNDMDMDAGPAAQDDPSVAFDADKSLEQVTRVSRQHVPWLQPHPVPAPVHAATPPRHSSQPGAEDALSQPDPSVILAGRSEHQENPSREQSPIGSPSLVPAGTFTFNDPSVAAGSGANADVLPEGDVGSGSESVFDFDDLHLNTSSDEDDPADDDVGHDDRLPLVKAQMDPRTPDRPSVELVGEEVDVWEEGDPEEDDPYLAALRELSESPEVQTTFRPLPVAPSTVSLPAQPIPAATADFMRRQPRWMYMTDNTRRIFEEMMVEASVLDETDAPMITVSNPIDPHLDPCPAFEFGYVNRYIYGKDVPRPEARLPGVGCSCIGSCSPTSRTCSCLAAQNKLWKAGTAPGFGYNENGSLRIANGAIVECGPDCECDEDCINRVAQRGRKVNLELCKTREKGWGVRSKETILPYTFIGIYAGELITAIEADKRGLYDIIGRTYLYDVDFAQLRELAQEGRSEAAQIDETKNAKKGKQKEQRGAKYTVDAFHAGFTRYFNHSCEPNLRTEPVFFHDFDREKPYMAFFASREIRPGEELCFAYHGEDEDEAGAGIVRPAAQLRDGASRKKGADEAAAIVAEGDEHTSAFEQKCKCGAVKCKGNMFKLTTVYSDDEDDEDDGDELEFDEIVEEEHVRLAMEGQELVVGGEEGPMVVD